MSKGLIKTFWNIPAPPHFLISWGFCLSFARHFLLVIFDPNREFEISARTHLMNIDYNMYEGMRVRGSADEVLLRGKPIVRARKYVGQPGDGQYIPRQRFRW